MSSFQSQTPWASSSSWLTANIVRTIYAKVSDCQRMPGKVGMRNLVAIGAERTLACVRSADLWVHGLGCCGSRDPLPIDHRAGEATMRFQRVVRNDAGQR